MNRFLGYEIKGDFTTLITEMNRLLPNYKIVTIDLVIWKEGLTDGYRLIIETLPIQTDPREVSSDRGSEGAN